MTVCEPCKEACAAQCEDASSVGDFYARRIRSLPSQPSGDVRELLDALDNVRSELARTRNGLFHSSQCHPTPGGCVSYCGLKRAGDVLDSFDAVMDDWRRRSSPERTAARPAREVAHEYLVNFCFPQTSGTTLQLDALEMLIERARKGET